MPKKKSSIKSKLEEVVFKPRQDFGYKADERILYDTIIIGSGVVGLSAAMYAGRLGLKTLIIGEMEGGTITLTHVVENYPGFVSLSGPKLGELMLNHAKDYDIDILNLRVDKIEKKPKCFIVKTGKSEFKSKTVILATGSKWKKLGIKGEDKYFNRGVSTCALCDGPLFKNKIVGIVGGSDSAVKEALLLSEYAKKVYIIYRGEKIHPEPINLTRAENLIKKGKIEIINKTNVVEIRGDGEKIISVVFDKVYKGKKEFSLDGLFIDIGHIPLSGLVVDMGVKINKKGEVIINRNSETNISGIYAAGDVTDTSFKQAITGVGEAVHAAYAIYEYVSADKVETM